MAASHALYQLSYGPRRGEVYPASGMGLDLRRSVMAARPMRHPRAFLRSADAADAGSALVAGVTLMSELLMKPLEYEA